MIYIIHKILVLIKNHLNCHKDNIFEFFFRKCDRLIFFLKIIFFSKYIMIENPRSQEEEMKLQEIFLD